MVLFLLLIYNWIVVLVNDYMPTLFQFPPVISTAIVVSELHCFFSPPWQ